MSDDFWKVKEGAGKSDCRVIRTRQKMEKRKGRVRFVKESSAVVSFEGFGLSAEILEAIRKKGYETPTEIQSLVIPHALEGSKDIIAQAKTGTGKTAAFGIPILEKLFTLREQSVRKIKVLILTPTRELALQIADELNALKGRKRLRITTIYGGQSYERQFNDLRKGVDIVVGTPGRILDHIERGTLDLTGVEFLVLDEADRMLDMGFLDDVKRIIEKLPSERRTFLFSATMPPEIVQIAKRFMKNYVHISTVTEELTTENATQVYFEVDKASKLPLLCRVIDSSPDFYGIVFCQTKAEVDEVSAKLIELGYSAEGLHGDFSQYQRERVLERFKKKLVRILVTTDVAARGIDIDGLTHVVNFSVPRDPEYYVHRVGRTGRAGKKGVAITFVSREEYQHFLRLKKFSKARIIKEEIPQIEEIYRRHLEALINQLEHLPRVENGLLQSFAERLIERFGSVGAVEMLLNELMRNKVDKNRYGEIGRFDFSEQGDERVRLFVALGSADGLDAKKLIAFIEEKTGVEASSVTNVRVFERYSFIDVPRLEGELIIKELNRSNGRRGKKLVDFAKAPKAPAERSNENTKQSRNLSREKSKEKSREKTRGEHVR
ncbi:DEAD/DEAH box helicase [Fervidobacterium thailandense]|uniref:DEAD/DEAH box helicase n=1 Tax=Fervidobacterium thailandense TaxID=1008305 RepID=UPI001F4D771A|nr:DEAD/DEAH box helicase [Fervidobacterium thailandense]